MRIHRSLPLITALVLSASFTFAQGIGPITTSVPKAKKRVGHPNSTIAQGYKLKKVVDGAAPLENPSGVITTFGRLSTGVATEPDENTYLVLDSNPGGPVPGLDYGRHFVFQGHEIFSGDIAYITRVNLDVKDPAHKITLLTPVGADAKTGLKDLDGSTHNPFTNTLLFTSELGAPGGVFELGMGWPATIRNLDGFLGKGGYEGIHPDDWGNLIIVEDVGGTTVNVIPGDPTSPKVARQPNSFVYRYVPYDVTDLAGGGKLQALQVTVDGVPLVFNGADPSGDVFAFAQVRLHTPGTSYPVQWVTVHDTAVDGTDPFDANALAKAAQATPFKRPENMAFLPNSNFQTLFFTATGDTNADAGTVDLAQRGSWGSLFRVDLDPDRESGTISIFVLGDADHASFDNISFADDHTLLAAEDRGNTLHGQLNKLDSVWAYATDGSAAPRRFVALGRDEQAEAEGEDNEPTGIHVSAGNPSPLALPGTGADLFNARGFLTRQHGGNQLWEIIKKF